MSSSGTMNLKLHMQQFSDCEADNREGLLSTPVLERHVALTTSTTSERPTFDGCEFVMQSTRFDSLETLEG